MIGEKRAEMRIPYVLVGLVLLVVLLVIVISASGSEYGNVRDFFKNLGLNVSTPSVEGVSILGYNLKDGGLYYYDGAKFVELKTSSGDDFKLNKKEFSGERVLENFEDYYYGEGIYSSKYASMGLRELPKDLTGGKLIVSQEDDNTLKNVFLTDFRESIFVGDFSPYPDRLQREKGLIQGSFERLEQDSSGWIYKDRLFIVTSDGNFWRTKGDAGYVQAGEISDVWKPLPFGEGQDDGEYVIAVKIFDVHIFDSFTSDRIKELGPLLKCGNYFCKEDNYGFEGEKTEFTVRLFQGKNWIYFKEQKLDVYIDGKRLMSRAQNVKDYKNFPPKKNERELIAKSVDWRDSIFVVPVEIEVNKGDNFFVCVERVNEYLVARLIESKVSENVVC